MAAWGFGVGGAVAAVLAAVAMVIGGGWLGQRVFWGAGLVVVSLVASWRRPGGRAGAAWASVLSAVGVLVVAADLSRVPGGDFDTRVLADDLPPVAGYVAAIGLGVSGVACGVAAVLRAGGRRVGPRRRAVTVAGVSGVAAVVLVAAVVPVGAAMRAAADLQAEVADLTLDRRARAERRADGPGPARPSRRVWSVETPPYPDGSVAVPGWDVVLVMSRGRPFWLWAVATSDGKELWRYRRDGAGGVQVTVDPEAGRILLADGDAAVVLDLADGSEVVTRRLPHPEQCGVMVHADALEVSPWVARECRDRDGDRWVSLVEVATGLSRAGTDPLPPDHRPDDGRYCETTVAPGAAPMVVQAGGDCPPQMAAYDPRSGDFRTPAPLELPPAWRDARRPPRGYRLDLESDPIATDDLVVLSLSWFLPDESPDATEVPEAARGVSEVVALDRAGDVLWRHPSAHAVLAVPDHGVLVRTSDRLELLALPGGTVIAEDLQGGVNDRRTSAEPVATTDGRRVYTLRTLGGTDLIVRDLANDPDLAVQEVHEGLAPHATTHMHATNGRLIFQTDDATLVAYEDGARGPTASPPARP